MPLSPAANRILQHTRTVICKGYRREDGLWDIEGHLVDVKDHDITSKERNDGKIPAGEAIHDMALRITIDLDLNIVDAEASMDFTPFQYCKGISEAYKKLIGLQIKPGFTKQTKILFSGENGCTHLLELLGPIATSAYQATYQDREKEDNWTAGNKLPDVMNTCHSWSQKSPVVQKHWPHFAKFDE
ncbi:DUF2889 domain-containing protein [Neptunomonas qingdaonensis]|uniref:DUF2889 domain-containing protein n=1 Tax=Neptunomonas qingdaonensis TaxID=1045558 RepID=A0A1I2QY46_9GAMM|nr:DUF2889 domain-containing protein [Neptunomonas qingdaonensis]SFG33168.1 Protein of unknown function [Neptunomonas qingdaonensis]